MKKFLLLVILFIVLINIDVKGQTAKRIDLKTKEGEVDVVFLKLKTNSSILINSLKESNLFFINYKNNRGIGDVLKIFDLKPNMYFLDKNKYYKNIKVINNNLIKLSVSGYDICIVKNLKEVKGCDFIYLTDLKDEFTVNEDVLAVFYDENINTDYLLQVNESWIDSHIVSVDSFTILKLNKEEYNILVIPLANN